MNYLPDKLTNLRKHYNYSQKHLAKILGVDTLTYMGYENGREILNYEQMVKLSKFYHIDLIEILKNDPQVTLYDVARQDTDKLNIEYFIPKNNIWFKLKRFVRNHKLLTGVFIGAVLFGTILFLILEIFKKPVVNEIIDINTLSVSNKTVLYLNQNGAVKGSGDNSNSQISNLPSENVVKVIAKDDYDLFLLSDGSIFSSGKPEDYIEEACEKYDDVIDIASGDNHLLILDSSNVVHCVGNDDFKQCELNGTPRINKIFAGKNATVLVDNRGNVLYSGDFVGRSSIVGVNDILDIDFSDTSLIYVDESGKIDYNTNLNNKHFIESLGWDDIIDVACGHDFLVGLSSDGNVFVASDNEKIKEAAESLKNIKAIDAADDYFIAYDGLTIYGFGKNNYNQFISSINYSSKLSTVENVHFESLENQIKVSFDPVYNASGYEVVFNGIVNTYNTNSNIILDASFVEEGSTCNISIKALGDTYFEDSDVYNIEYVYKFSEDKIMIREDLFDLNKDELDAYLKELNIDAGFIEAIQLDEKCSGDKIDVSDLIGLMPGREYTVSELLDVHVRYNYCTLRQEDENEESLES